MLVRQDTNSLHFNPPKSSVFAHLKKVKSTAALDFWSFWDPTHHYHTHQIPDETRPLYQNFLLSVMCYECHKITMLENSSKESKAQYNTKIVEVENTVSLVSIHKPNYHKVTTTYPPVGLVFII